MKNIKPLCVALLLALYCLSSCEKNPSILEQPATLSNSTTYYGEKVKFCHGSIQSFVRLNSDKEPIALGVRFTEETLNGLPQDPAKNVANAILKVPEQGTKIGIDHIEFGWNPKGHDPSPIYTHPHFDLHFYMVTKEEQAGVVPGPDPILVSPDFIPADYISGVDAVPNMGVHYVDVTSPEFNGMPFTSTFIYGFYQGKMTFTEPMFTYDYLLTKPQFSAVVKQPLAFQKSGYYATSYRIAYDTGSKDYIIAAEGLKFHIGKP
jgi:hypothetical protein